MARLGVLRRLDMFLVLWRHKSGSALIEYSLIVAIIVGMVLAVVAFLGGWVSGMFSSVFPP
jgi:Flp pilus assembly pilin Flp